MSFSGSPAPTEVHVVGSRPSKDRPSRRLGSTNAVDMGPAVLLAGLVAVAVLGAPIFILTDSVAAVDVATAAHVVQTRLEPERYEMRYNTIELQGSRIKSVKVNEAYFAVFAVDGLGGLQEKEVDLATYRRLTTEVQQKSSSDYAASYSTGRWTGNVTAVDINPVPAVQAGLAARVQALRTAAAPAVTDPSPAAPSGPALR